MRLAPRYSENFRKFADRTSQIKSTNVSDKHGDVIKPFPDKNEGSPRIILALDYER